MSIVIELQKEALDANSDILSILRKAFVVARKLKLKELEEWINNELIGYKNNINEIPDYRHIKGKLQAHNPFYGWIPVNLPNDDIEKLVCHRKIPDSIPSIQSLLKSGDSIFAIHLGASQNALLSELTDFETEYHLQISMNDLSNITEQVKNKVLDWAMILEENGIMGEGLVFTDKEKTVAQNSSQITNYISNFYGNINDSQIQTGTDSSVQKK